MGPGWGMSRSVTSCALGKKTNRRIFLCKHSARLKLINGEQRAFWLPFHTCSLLAPGRQVLVHLTAWDLLLLHASSQAREPCWQEAHSHTCQPEVCGGYTGEYFHAGARTQDAPVSQVFPQGGVTEGRA